MITSFDGEQNLGVYLILLHESKVLLAKRKNSYKAGWYGFPGGRLNIGEPILTCARRELLEEIGVTPIECELIGAVREAQEGYDFIHFAVLVNSWKGEIKCMEPDKSETWQWISKDDLPELLLPGHKAGLQLLQHKHHIIDLH